MNMIGVKSACLERLRQIYKNLTWNELTNHLDIGSNSINKNKACFIKMHLKWPHVDGIVLFHGTHAFVLELEGKKRS